MSSLRVYLVIPTFLPIVGGSERQALAHGRSLRERGFLLTIMTFRHDRHWLPREEVEGVPIIRVAGTLLGRRERLPRPLRKAAYLLGLLAMGWRLWQERQHYDIIHLHHLNVLALVVGAVCLITEKPLLISVRAAGLVKISRSSSKVTLMAGPLDPNTPWLQYNGRAKTGGDLEDLERLGKPVIQITNRLLRRIHAQIIILSSQTEEYLALHGFDLPGTLLIPNGVDTVLFAPEKVSASDADRTKIVICVSRLDYQKGIDVLLQAWRLVQQELAEARLIIVGAGPLQAQLERLARALAIQESVEFAGLRQDIPAQLHRAGLAVLPSRCEGMPNAVLEAMAAGLPCVATRVSGCQDIIDHEINGLLVEPEDYQALARALLILLRDPVLAQQYGRAARSTIEQRYSREHITDRYIELYQRFLSSEGHLAGKVCPAVMSSLGKDGESCVE